MPRFLDEHLDSGMAEGVGWKLARVPVHDDCFELALHNDCILWGAPNAIHRWLTDGVCVLAENVRACFGQFAPVLGPEPRNSGIRGPPVRARPGAFASRRAR